MPSHSTSCGSTKAFKALRGHSNDRWFMGLWIAARPSGRSWVTRCFAVRECGSFPARNHKNSCHLREGGDPGSQKQTLIHATLDSRLRGSDGGGIEVRDTLPSRPEQGPRAYASEAKRADARARRMRALYKPPALTQSVAWSGRR